MKFKLQSLLTSKDIIPNVYDTYPVNSMTATNEDEFYSFLKETDCNIVCYHATRLTAREISAIKEYGLSLGGKDLLRKKIVDLPSCCDWFKDELINYVNANRERARNTISASYGFLDWEKDLACNKEFVKYWGGESIYTYFCDNLENEYFKKIHDTLTSISFPCIVLLRVNVYDFCKACTTLYEKTKTDDMSKLSGSVYIEDQIPQIIDVLRLDFEGFEYY